MASRGRVVFLALATSVLALDQIVKSIMNNFLFPRGKIAVVPGLFDLTYVRNQGAVFGIFRDLPEPWRSILLTVVPVIAVFFVVVLAYRTPAHRLRPLSGLGLILGGAVGNLVDRVRYHSVVDFLDFYVADYHWPAFNLADSAICTGVALLALDIWRSPSSTKHKSRRSLWGNPKEEK